MHPLAQVPGGRIGAFVAVFLFYAVLALAFYTSAVEDPRTVLVLVGANAIFVACSFAWVRWGYSEASFDLVDALETMGQDAAVGSAGAQVRDSLRAARRARVAAAAAAAGAARRSKATAAAAAALASLSAAEGGSSASDTSDVISGDSGISRVSLLSAVDGVFTAAAAAAASEEEQGLSSLNDDPQPQPVHSSSSTPAAGGGAGGPSKGWEGEGMPSYGISAAAAKLTTDEEERKNLL